MSKHRLDLINLLLSLLFLIVSTALGALLGGVFLKLFVEPASNGWDGIAQALGALMLGGLVGIALSAVALVPLLRRGRPALLRTVGIVTGLTLMIFGTLWILAPRRDASPPSPPLEPRPTTAPAQPVSPDDS